MIEVWKGILIILIALIFVGVLEIHHTLKRIEKQLKENKENG